MNRVLAAVFVIVSLSATMGLSSRHRPDVANVPAEDQAVRFSAIDVFIDSGAAPLAAYQFELKLTGGAKIVGLEGGEHGAFAEAPFYDPAALMQDRVIVADYSLAPASGLPMGRTRVARIHVQLSNIEMPQFEAVIIKAASADGGVIDVKIVANEGALP